jgi:4-diphosphocytidyl-2-C-methyl-D-erythritol kinase
VSGRAARVVAQAKINLGLRVLAREADGYHGIETVFARLELGDEVTVRVTSGTRSLDCRGADTGPVEQNLAWRAAMAMREATGFPAGFAITIEKRIPVGAGLGGGSADAGAVLRALNALSPEPVKREELLRIAATLGADVPFLTAELPFAFGSGRGEQLRSFPPLPERNVVLVQPGFSVSTVDAYRWLDADRGGDAPAAAGTGTRPAVWTWDTIAPLTANDFEPVLARRHPVVADVAEGLRRAGAFVARLTGSGSSVYGIFATPPDPAALKRALPYAMLRTRTVTRVASVQSIADRA